MLKVNMARSTCNGFHHNRSCYQTVAANLCYTWDSSPDCVRQWSPIHGKFKQFCWSRDIHHTTTAPYHPHSSGDIERFVQTFKQSVDKANPVSFSELQDCVLNFLACYRAAPHSVTDQTPSEMLKNRRMHTRLGLLHPAN